TTSAPSAATASTPIATAAPASRATTARAAAVEHVAVVGIRSRCQSGNAEHGADEDELGIRLVTFRTVDRGPRFQAFERLPQVVEIALSAATHAAVPADEAQCGQRCDSHDG